MPTLIVKRTNLVLAPRDATLAFKLMSHVRNPNLLRQGFGNLLFLVGFPRVITKLHYQLTERTPYIGLPGTVSPDLQ